MCAIIGALVWGMDTSRKRYAANDLINSTIRASHERGRDGRGFAVNGTPIFKDTRRGEDCDWDYMRFFVGGVEVANCIGNLRAEPTTEYVAAKSAVDQQPYKCGDWSIVHNGTIANDIELRESTHELDRVDTRIDSAAIAEALARSPLNIRTHNGALLHFTNVVKQLRGSFAILATHAAQPNHIMVAANYRPIWYAELDYGVFFASARHYFPGNLTPRMLEPYTTASFAYSAGQLCIQTCALIEHTHKRALVVCSGGLDSMVAAAYAKRIIKLETELIHFRYGSRAEGMEVQAVHAVATALDTPCTIFHLPVYKPSDSPLLRKDSTIAGGEAGAEFAYEWVPARNLVMLSVATAFAEANGFDTIVLGNNLEEAGAYPDNEPEFIARFNDLLPFAVADGKRVRVLMPVGNMMKHEIVRLGHTLKAPLDKTWSCYRAGPVHCGTCGPCYMRRKAFEINGLPEVIPYANEG